MNRGVAIPVALLWAVLASGCAAASLSCRPGEPTADCCIKNYPLSPVESCAASEEHALLILNGIRMAIDEGDFANNAELPEWKQQCIKSWVRCKQEGWMGPCYACLRRCEGQREWPEELCHPR